MEVSIRLDLQSNLLLLLDFRPVEIAVPTFTTNPTTAAAWDERQYDKSEQ